jgi:hypothetical protein
MRWAVADPYRGGMRHVLGTVCLGAAMLLLSSWGRLLIRRSRRHQAGLHRTGGRDLRTCRPGREGDLDRHAAGGCAFETTHRLRRGVSNLKALDRPAGHDQELEAWFHDLDQEVAVFSGMQPAADAGDQAELDRLFASTERLGGKIQRAAQRFGFHDCAR